MTVDTWFGDAELPTLGFLHVPEGDHARGGVVICPPLGHEQVIAYRAMRLLGQELADRGLAALRFDYVGEGDASGASAAPDAVERWLATIENAVAYLRASGVEQVALVGLTSGGLLAAEALGRLSGVTGLVLWDPTLSGRRFLRRQKSIHEMTVGGDVATDERVPLLSLTLHSTAARWLEGAEITGATLAASNVETLLIGRRADTENSATVKLLAALPATVDYRAVDGQEDLLDVASSIAVIPAGTIGTIADWLSGRFATAASPVTPTVTTVATVGVAADGTRIIEKLGRFGAERIFTIETVLDDAAPHPDRGLVVMQPAAAEHRIGPGRFQVAAARELAGRGYRAVRFDRRITGETTEVVATEPNMVLAKEWVDDGAALATSMAQGAPLALVGLCSGAWVSARIAEQTAARLTVLLDINYYRTKPYLPGHYAALARLDQHGEPQLSNFRSRLRDIIPGWLWRLVSPTQVFNDPTLLLTPPSSVPGSTVALLLSPEDDAVLVKNRGADAVRRLRDAGADIRVTSYDFGDHALFGEGVRTAMLHDIVELVESSIPRSQSGVESMIPRFIEKAFGSDGTKSLGIFGATVILNGAISLITIPIVVAVVGADAWASMATGQSVGASLAAVVLFGWGLTGPATVAMTAPGSRPTLFLDSLIARAYLLLPLLVIQAAVTFAIVPQEKIVALISGTAMLLAGVSANWFFTGEGRSGRFLVFDTVPRVAGTVLGLLLVVTTGQLIFFSLAQLLGSTVALVASAIVILRGKQLDFRAALRWSRVFASLASQRHGVVATGLNAAFMPAVLGIVAVASPALLPVFVLANRLTSFIGMALSPMFLLFQGWVPAARGHELARRIKLSATITAVAAVFSGVLCATLLPTFGVVLTHSQVIVETGMAITFGALAIVQTGSPYLSNVGLMSVGQVRVIARSTAVGLPLAIVLFAIVELLGGAQFAAWGLIAGGSIAAAWQILALSRAVALLPPEPEPAPAPNPHELSAAQP